MTLKSWTLATVAVAVTAAGLSAIPSPAKAETALEKILRLFIKRDREQEGPPPEETLQAPFSPTSAAAAPAGGALAGMYNTTAENGTDKPSTNLETPHRSPEQVAEWASGIVAQAMTIVPQSWDSDFAKLSPQFLPYAAQEYKGFLTSVNMITLLSNQRMKLLSVADGPGIVLKEGALNGAYHWLIQVPLLATYYGTDIQEIEKGTNAQNQKLLVQVQVGRVAPKSGQDIGLVIERWHVSQSSTQ